MRHPDPFWNALASFGVQEVALPRPRRASGEVAPAGASGDELERLRARVEGCAGCRLAQGRNRTVFGDGDPRAGILFVGEGPGAQEDQQGVPFVGKAGELLDRILASISLDRSTVYIANVVKCRPPENRTPAPDEVEACFGYLEEQVRILRPGIIIALGASAAGALLNTRRGIGVLRGTLHAYRGVDVLVTYHPAALLRSPALKRPVWEDMKNLQTLLREKGLPRGVRHG